MHKKILSGFIAASLIASMPAMAKGDKKRQVNRQSQTRQMSMEERWNRLDRNRDGVLSRSEWLRDQGSFDRIDRNDDNVLSRSEARAAAERRQRDARQIRHQGIDRNRDGVITRAEWRGNDTSFRNHDRNRDGVLSGEELRPASRRSSSNRFDDRFEDDRRDSMRMRQQRDHDDDDDDRR